MLVVQVKKFHHGLLEFLPSSGGSDACLLCANSAQITVAYKSSGVWVSCKRIG